MSAAVCRVVDLVKVYNARSRPANDHVTFEVHRGEFFGILGANGAGKSTLVRQMMNLLRPTSGSIELFGQPLDWSAALRVGYMPQHAEALNRLTVEEALYYTAHLRGLSREQARNDRDAQIGRWNLQSVRAQDSATLSGGERRLLRLAVALAGNPEIVILDEPTSDLDPIRRRLVWDSLHDINRTRGTTVVFITHDAVEAEKVVDRVAIMREGRLVATGRPAELKRAVGRSLRIDIRFLPSHPPDLPSRRPHDELTSDRMVLYRDWHETADIFRRLNPEQIEDLRITLPTLEDVFIHHAHDAEATAVRNSVR